MLPSRTYHTEREMSSFWRNLHHRLHWKLSFWQLPVQQMMAISSKWGHFRFSVYWGWFRRLICRGMLLRKTNCYCRKFEAGVKIICVESLDFFLAPIANNIIYWINVFHGNASSTSHISTNWSVRSFHVLISYLIGSEAKWPAFCSRRHFRMYIAKWKLNVLKSDRSFSTGLDTGLALFRRQAIV